MKPSLLPAAFALALLGSLAATNPLRAADDTTRRAQQALRDGGFYYGPIDGVPGDDTTQSIRRYQIRNGLAVSGQLNAETLRSLNINATPPPSAPVDRSARPDNNNRAQRPEPTPPPLATPAPAPKPTPPRTTITGRPPSTTVPTPPPAAPREDQPVNPPSSSPYNNRPDLRVAPLPPGAQAPSVPLTGFFSRTPYEFAPPAVQADVLRRAQRALAQGGFYDGPADGQPGRRTVEALGELQGAYRLPRTRRLDTMTLRFLRLNPGMGSNLPEPIPSRRRGAPEPDDENEETEEDDGPPVRVRPRSSGPEVYQGRIIR